MCDDRHWERKRAKRLADWRVSVRAWLRTSKWVGGRNNWTPYWWRGWVSPEFMIQTPEEASLRKLHEKSEKTGSLDRTMWAAVCRPCGQPLESARVPSVAVPWMNSYTWCLSSVLSYSRSPGICSSGPVEESLFRLCETQSARQSGKMFFLFW